MKLISSIVKESDFESHQEYFKARFLVVLSGIFLMLGIFYVFIYVRLYDYPIGGFSILGAAVINLVNLYLLKRYKSIAISGNLSALMLFAALLVVVYSMGGIQAHANVWFASLIVLAFMVLSKGSGFFWSGAVGTTFVVMFLLESADHTFPDVIGDEVDSAQTLITFLGSMTTVMVLAYFFQSNRDRAFNLVDETLNTTVKKLENTREQLLETANFTNDKAQHVNSFTHEVSTNLNDVNKDIQQFNDSIHKVEENVSEADQISERAHQITRETEAHIVNLRERSEEIGKVVDVINSVATQVNLLALNASVEAVRAGQAGSGFSIVADEIKNLAHKTSENTNQIEETINNVQEEIGAITDKIGDLEYVINNVNAKQKDISGAVKDQSNTTSNMVERVNESTRRGDEIKTMVEDLAKSAASLIHEASGSASSRQG